MRDNEYISNDLESIEIMEKVRNMTDEEFKIYINQLKEQEREEKSTNKE